MASIVTVQTSTGTLEVPFAVIQMSETIKQMMDDLQITEANAAELPIPIKQVDDATMAKIVEWCAHHKDGNSKDVEGPICPRFVDDNVIEDWVENKKFKHFDENFLSELEKEPAFLLQVLKDANYLHIKGLIELVSWKIANMLNGKSSEQLLSGFGIFEDQTPEAIKAIDDEVSWLNKPAES